MKRFRKSLAAIAAAVALATAAMVIHGSVGTAQPVASDYWVEHLNTEAVNVQTGPSWTSTPLTVTLPRAGTYALDADVRARLIGAPSVNAYISARLWNDTSNTVVPQSERLVYQIHDPNAGAGRTAGNQTAPISELIRVNGPTTIRLEAVQVVLVGTVDNAEIFSNRNGYTSLRYERLSS